MTSALATRDDSDDLRVFSPSGFELAQRIAKSLASSTLVPKIYQGQEGLANCLIALEIANRIKTSPMVVMQNMVPINGRPSWSSQYLIGTVNACGRFSPLRYIFDNEDEPTSCYCEATDLASGEVLRGEKITIAMAKAEGWYSRSGSKWPTIPGQMLRFRAASWWQRVYCPELSLGLPTQEETIDVEAVTVAEIPAAAIAPVVPAPLTHRAEEVAEVEAPTPGPEPQASNSEALPSSPNLEASSPNLEASSPNLEATSGPEQPAPATKPGTAERLPQEQTIVAADPQPAPAPAPAAPAGGRRSAPAPVRRPGPAAAPDAEAPIPGLD
jgi:hypothetical protein